MLHPAEGPSSLVVLYGSPEGNRWRLTELALSVEPEAKLERLPCVSECIATGYKSSVKTEEWGRQGDICNRLVPL